ncbi:MAG TPA: helix-turn-helix domain-containing protein [Planctomycetota bacterium]|nr:helix-turn-helix domain-containing protein [Planctomycetota bacterium]
MPDVKESELRSALAALPDVVNVATISVGDVWGQNFHATPSHELVHVLQGRARIEFEGYAADVGPGDTFIVPRGTKHRDVRSTDNDYRVLYIFFQWESGAKLLRRIDARALSAAPESARPHLRLLMTQIETEFNSDAGDAGASKQRLSLILLEILLALSRYSSTSTGRAASDARQKLARTRREQLATGVRKYLEEHCGETLSLDGLAEHFEVSPFHLSRSFSQQYGVSLVEMLTMLRIDRAAELLKERRLSVKEIAVAVGIPDPNYFAKVFRRVRGQSPTEFQARLK